MTSNFLPYSYMAFIMMQQSLAVILTLWNKLICHYRQLCEFYMWKARLIKRKEIRVETYLNIPKRILFQQNCFAWNIYIYITLFHPYVFHVQFPCKIQFEHSQVHYFNKIALHITLFPPYMYFTCSSLVKFNVKYIFASIA